MRLAWRVGQALPALVETLPDWQKVTARLVHLCLYALMFALPLTGWLMSSAAGFTVSFLGLFELPDLVPPSDFRFRGLIAIHRWLAYALLALTLVTPARRFGTTSCSGTRRCARCCRARTRGTRQGD